jgi:hypothetical protein
MMDGAWEKTDRQKNEAMPTEGFSRKPNAGTLFRALLPHTSETQNSCQCTVEGAEISKVGEL